MSNLRKILRDERGFSTPEWLIMTALFAALTVGVVGILLPAVRNAHNTVVDRITNLTGSGF